MSFISNFDVVVDTSMDLQFNKIAVMTFLKGL